jgi:molybdopterin-guanine dinucleotide biosynthesis protein A
MAPACHHLGAPVEDGGVTWAAVVLTGGTAARLGGTDKAALELAGRTLLARALDAVAGAAEIVVAGPPTATTIEVRFVREQPMGGGPLAGAAAAVAALEGDHDLVVVLAVDMPRVTTDTVSRLLAAAAAHGVDAAWLTDSHGRRQLAGAVRPALVPAPEVAQGAPMRRLMDAGTVRDVPAMRDEATDVDTWADLERLRT